MIRASMLAVSLLFAAACTPSGDTTSGPAQDPAPTTREEATAADTCGASQYQAMIGTPIAAASFPADPNIRVIMPDSAVTQDFRAERLNVIVDANGAISALECY